MRSETPCQLLNGECGGIYEDYVISKSLSLRGFSLFVDSFNVELALTQLMGNETSRQLSRRLMIKKFELVSEIHGMK